VLYVNYLNVSPPFSPVLILTASSTLLTKILPSPTLPVDPALVIASIVLSRKSSLTTMDKYLL
tara:strand:- start:258 stop:446 length:189 start_codon:yes stop_codon:yes gene_type:complete